MKLSHSESTHRDHALAKIDAVHLGQYAKTRNDLNGRVSGLSPYLTHGITDVPEVLRRIQSRTTIGWNDKFAFELGWREYFHHVWRVRGDEIWTPMRPPPASETAYQTDMPEDVLTASTGIAVIDDQIRVLYGTGYLHNHARMWLASYLVHIRKIDWRAGAKWMYGYLLDGDWASNTLSWQWVAGTWTGKPYLFNAENVAKYAPAYVNAGTAIDQSYEALDQAARSSAPLVEPLSRRPAPTTQPALFDASIVYEIAVEIGLSVVRSIPSGFQGMLGHPWNLRASPGSDALGLIVPAFHTEARWSEQRWRFVLQAMRDICEAVWVVGDEMPTSAAGIETTHTNYPQYCDVVSVLAERGMRVVPPPRAFIDPDTLQKSFSSFWHRANKESFPA
jgi:deoxyribodipyrimidine photo-lyase